MLLSAFFLNAPPACHKVSNKAVALGMKSTLVCTRRPNSPKIITCFLFSQMVPFGGMGANMAIQSALKLANVIYDIESDSQKDIKWAFDEYFRDRQGDCKGAVNASNYNGAFIHAKVSPLFCLSQGLSATTFRGEQPQTAFFTDTTRFSLVFRLSKKRTNHPLLPTFRAVLPMPFDMRLTGCPTGWSRLVRTN